MTYEPIQTVEHVRAIANYGPTATLFTLGPNHSIQQYDLETGDVVANTQHFPMTIPPTPPEEKQQFEYLTSSSTEDLASPAGKSSAQEMFEAARQARIQMGSPQSFQSRDSDKSGSLQPRARYPTVVSPSSRTERTERTERSVTNISVGTQSHIAPSAYGLPPNKSQHSPVSNRSRKGSRLKQEVLPSPESAPMLDLFPYTRARLNDVPYKPVRPGDESNLSTDDLRRQMLEVVFGWEEDAPELVRDELSRHPPASQTAILLAKWLNDDPEQMSNVLGSAEMSSQLDWMMLALSGMGNHAASKKMGLNFVEKKLREGDIHAAAIILLTLGDRNDAIEVYLEANYYLEAVLLTCLLMPNDWGRLKHLVRKWGEYVVDKSQQYLAIRCFSCTDIEPAGEWTSPTAQLATSNPEKIRFPQPSGQMHSDVQRRNFFTAPTPIAMMKPQTPMPMDPHKQQAQRGPLKLITSFGPQEHHILKFPGLKSDDRTPTVGHGVTPIAESAINESALTPGGAGSYRLNNMRSINSALLSGRTATPGGFHRQRLPSIGETPIDSNPPQFPLTSTPVNVPKALPTPADSGSEKEKEQEKALKNATEETLPAKEEKPTLTLSSARYEPSETPAKETPLTAVAPSTAVKFSRRNDMSSMEAVVPPPLVFEEKKPRSRGGSRSRKPDGLSIQMIPVHERDQSDLSETTGDSLAYQSLHRSNTINSNTTTQFDSHSEMTSPPTTGNSYYDHPPTTGGSLRSMTKSPSVTGRSIDQYISSLEQAQYYTKPPRSRTNGSQDGMDRTPRKKSKNRDHDDDRGRNERRAIPSSKRSPSSPVPMSPDDLSLYTAPSIESFDSIFEGEKQMEIENRRIREEKKLRAKKPRSESRHEDRQRVRSRSRGGEGRRSKPTSGHVSRRATPEPYGDPYARGRSASKLDGSTLRSPSSPLPMTPTMEDLRTPVEGALRLVSRNRERRDRSGSRRADRGTSSRREASPDRRRREGRSGSRKPSENDPREQTLSRKSSVSTKGERRRKRAQSNEQGSKTDRETLSSSLISPSMYESSVYSSIAPEDSISQVSTVDPDYRSQSNPQFLHHRKKALAAAELEARRLSLARRPSAPAIPMPGQSTLHNKSASMDAAPTLARSKTDFIPTLANINSIADRMEARNSPRAPGSDSGSSGKGSNGPRRQGTPRAMRHPTQDSSIPDIPENMVTLLGSETYRPPKSTEPVPRSMSAPHVKDESIRVPPSDLPKHPAFDMRIPNSRSSSKADEHRRAMSRERGRGASRERGMSKDRRPPTRDENQPPPILPELQHLAMPPPPPPPPQHPMPGDQSQGLKLQTAFTPPVNQYNPSAVPLPQSGMASEPPSATAQFQGHRRGRSGNESTGMFGGLRNLADRMRSTSRGRDTRSPPTEDTVSPYESIPLPPNYHQRAAQIRSPIIQEEETVAMSPYESIPDGPPPQRGVPAVI